ncbi:recombinase family protein [Lacipirellula sp.]|uniref:recombinase family protein n=1 Tax=Lacipirellula sp. TaxID=2691419 RepID=UPI003D14738A
MPIPDGRPLRVAIYARYSTEEQDASSIKDQFLKCRQLRELRSLSNVQFMEFSDAELSGELLRRPGIDQVKGIVDQRGCDVLICEESSRLFRAVAPTLDLVGLAFDREVRVLIINEDIDTADESWPDKLTDASSHHARSNRICGLRIKRKHDGLWEEGAAIGGLRPGYLRVPTTPPSLGKEAEGPFFDKIDPEWTDTIVETFERIANGDAPWMVAEWLTTEALPKCSNSTTPEWNAKCVISLIRRLDYRGIQQFRTSVVKKEHSTGKHKLVKNKDLDKILMREMPHLRIVTDVLWYAANAAIDARIAVRKAAVSTHPLVGVPRDSRGPLSGIFYCGVCNSKMYQDGRGTGGYRCSGVRSNECWNKATADRNLTHAELGKAIFAAILGERDQVSVSSTQPQPRCRLSDPSNGNSRLRVSVCERSKVNCKRLRL